MTEPPAFQLYAATFFVDTAEWSVDEVGIYWRLLEAQWCNKSLPDNITRLARIAGCSPQKFQKAWGQIAIKFTKNGDGRLINLRLEKEREKQQNYRESQAEKGRRGAEKRWGEDSTSHSHGHNPSNDREIALYSLDLGHKEKEGGQAPALLFPLKDGTEYPLGIEKISEYEKTYRNIDVSFELKKCLQWNIDNPGKRKTKQGILKHINGWLADESKKIRPQPQAGPEYSNDAVEEARRDVARADPEKAREKIKELATGIGAVKL